MLEDHLKCLTKLVHPPDLVLQKWKETASHRLAELPCSIKYDSVQTYFNTFPALKQPDGYKLLESDFDHLYPDKGNLLFANLVLYQERIFQLGRLELEKERKRECDKFINSKLTDYLSHSQSDDFQLRNSIALLLLPYIAEVPKSRKDNFKVHFRPSRKMIIDSFILIVDEVEEIEQVLEERRKVLAPKNRTVQPFLAVIGDYKAPRAIHIVVNETYYEASSIAEGINLLFKIFFAAWIRYPCECIDIWHAIQLGFYDISLPQISMESPNAEGRRLMNQMGMKVPRD